MTTMTRGLSIPRRAVQAATSRGNVMLGIMPDRVAVEGRPAAMAGHDERAALRHEHAFVEAAAIAALRGARV